MTSYTPSGMDEFAPRTTAEQLDHAATRDDSGEAFLGGLIGLFDQLQAAKGEEDEIQRPNP